MNTPNSILTQLKTSAAPKILLPLTDGVEEMEAVIVADILRRADMMVVLASLAPILEPILASREIRLVPDAAWDSLPLPDFDALVLPGGYVASQTFASDQRVLEALKSFLAENKTVAAICAAPLALHAAGVISDRRVTCYPGLAPELTGAVWVNERVVIDCNLITSQGPATAMEFALALIRVLQSPGAADTVAQDLLLQNAS